MKRLLFIVTEDWYFVSHRLHLATLAVNAGYNVALLTRVSIHREVIENSGVEIINWSIIRQSLNMVSELKSIKEIISAIDYFKPDIVHTVALKPALYTSLVFRIIGSYTHICALGGLGFIFSSNKYKAKILRSVVVFFLRWGLKSSKARVILQNPDDMELLSNLNVTTRENTCLIRGAGVDTERYKPFSEVNREPIVLLPARMLWDKGVGDFVQSARFVQHRMNNVRFVLVGDPDPHNPESVSIDQLNAWVEEGVVEWWGHKDDMPNIYRHVSVVCFPSYREGLPKVLIEAASCGVPIVTYDVPGCREVVIDGVNGCLVPFKRIDVLVEGIVKMLNDPVLCANFGQAGRELVIKEFSQEKVASMTLKVWEEVLK